MTFLFPRISRSLKLWKGYESPSQKGHVFPELPGNSPLFSRKTGVPLFTMCDHWRFLKSWSSLWNFKTCSFSFQVGESHPYRHPSLPREKKVWLDPSNTVHLRRYDGMCREWSYSHSSLKTSCGSKGSHSLKCETQESLSQMLFLHQGRMFSFGNPLEIGPVFVYILCWWICKMFRGLFPKQELGFGLLIFFNLLQRTVNHPLPCSILLWFPFPDIVIASTHISFKFCRWYLLPSTILTIMFLWQLG